MKTHFIVDIDFFKTLNVCHATVSFFRNILHFGPELISGDSHLQGIKFRKLNFRAVMDARGGRRAHHLSESTFRQKEYSKYEAFFILLGGNDVYFHDFHNPNPKTPQEPAQQLFSFQFVLEAVDLILFNSNDEVMQKNLAATSN